MSRTNEGLMWTPGTQGQLVSVFCGYGGVILLLLGAFLMMGHLSGGAKTKDIEAMPPRILIRTQSIMSQFVSDPDPMETTVFSNRDASSGPARMMWTIVCASPKHEAQIIFEQSNEAIVQFSQTIPKDRSVLPQVPIVKDTQTAETLGYRYLNMLCGANPREPWRQERQPQSVRDCWRLFFQQGQRHASLNIYAVNGELLRFLKYYKKI